MSECQPLAILRCEDQAATVVVSLPSTGISLVYRSDRVPGRKTAPTADVRGQGLGGFTVDIHHSYDPTTKVLLQGDGVRRLVTSVDSGGELLVASTDARQAFIFDKAGRHRRTLDTVTGSTLWTFEHDASGRLSRARDQAGQQTTFDHDSSGHLAAIVRPGGTTLRTHTDSDGYLTSLETPGGSVQSFTYGSGGLLSANAQTDAGRMTYDYDQSGLLERRVDQRGGTTSFTRGSVDGGYSVDIVTPAGRKLRYVAARQADGVHGTLVDAAGGKSEEAFTSERSRHYRDADGTTIDLTLAADPRYGMQAPVLERVVTATPGGRRTTVEQRRDVAASDRLGGGPFKETVTRDGHRTQIAFDPGTHTMTSTDPTGMKSLQHFDDRGRVNGIEAAGATAASTYDETGHLTSVTSGSGSGGQQVQFEYDVKAGTRTVVDASGGRTVQELDTAGRTVSEKRPDGTVAEYDRNATGRITAVWAPGRDAHELTALRDGLPVGSFPPGAGGAVDGTVRSYDPDGLLSAVGQGRTPGVSVDRDAAGRATGVHLSSGVATYSYNGADLFPTTTHGPGDVALVDEHDGGQLTAERWSGPVNGSVELHRDGAGLTSGVAVDGTPLAIVRDAAGRATGVGDLRITYDRKSGLPSSVSLGSATEAVGLDGSGRLRSLGVDVAGSRIAAMTWTRDSAGRTTELAQTGSGGAHTSSYSYDVNGRLKSETRDAVRTELTYDSNDNVVGVTGPDAATGSVDARDRLTSFGGDHMIYASDGTLRSRTGTGSATTYTYDEHLALTQVGTPSHRIDYLTDGLGRRIGKRVDGNLVQGFLWAGTRLVAELDGGGRLVSRFIYGDGAQPLAMLRNGRAYLLLSDGVGTVRAVVDAQTGEVAERIDTDAWGKVLADSAPNLQPFGFDGGIRDADTGLVRLGVRDYDPQMRRFTAPDPIGYDGGQINLYAFAHNEPVDGADPSGLDDGQGIWTGGWSVEGSVFAGTGVAVGVNLQWFGSPFGMPSAYIYTTADPKPGRPDLVRGGGPSAVGNEVTQVGGGAGLSTTVNLGRIHNPSKSPADDYLGDTDVINLSGGPAALGGYHSPPNSDPTAPSYGGGNAGLGFGTPSFDYGTTTSRCFFNCGKGHFWGDPHFLSHDGLVYAYQGAGEYVGLVSHSGDLAVQLRLEPFLHGGDAVSRATAAAMNVAGDHVGVYRIDAEGRGELRLVVNGQEVKSAQQTIALPHGGRLSHRRGLVDVIWPDGSRISYGRAPLGVLDCEYQLADGRKGDVVGLMGAYTGDPTKSLVTRSGTTLAVKADQSVAEPDRLRTDFGDGWRISQAESLFDDLPGQDVAHYTVAGYPTTATTIDALDPSVRADAERVCRSEGLMGSILAACVLDVALTGSAGMAGSARSAAASAGESVPVKGHFDIAVGDTISRNHPAMGAGHVDDGEIQQYALHLDKDQVIFVTATASVGLASATATYRVVPRSESAGTVAGSVALSDSRLRLSLTAGDWVVEVHGRGSGDFTMHITAVPADAHFGVRVGDTVSPGRPAPDAGHLRGAGQRQMYDFAAAPGQVVHLRMSADCDPHAKISYRITIASDLDTVGDYVGGCIDLVSTLAGGPYTVEVMSFSGAGDYGFTLSP